MSAVELLAGTVGNAVSRSAAQRSGLRIAAADAFTKALQAAGVTVLEPIMRLEVTTPEEHLGDVINDLQQRRAIINSTENRGGMTVLEAERRCRRCLVTRRRYAA